MVVSVLGSSGLLRHRSRGRFRSHLDFASLRDCSIRGTKFRKSILKEADFTDSDLSESKFHGAVLSGAIFTNAILELSDLSEPATDPTRST